MSQQRNRDHDKLLGQLADINDSWIILNVLIGDDKGVRNFRERYMYLANDMIYTYTLSYINGVCKLFDPAIQNGHKNFSFEYLIGNMRRSSRKDDATVLLIKVARLINKYRTIRNKIASHLSKQVISSEKELPMPNESARLQIHNSIHELYCLIFNTSMPSLPVQTSNDIHGLMHKLA